MNSIPTPPSLFCQKIVQEALTFDDLLLIPNYSEVLPHETKISSFLAQNLKIEIPILSAAMDTITEHELAITLARLGGLGVIHKNLTPQAQAEEVKLVKKLGLLVGAATGVGPFDLEKRIPTLFEAGVDVLVVDTAHGHSLGVIKTLEQVKKNYGNKMILVAGNIATGEAALALANAGVDCVKVGIGPGSICTTRMVAGVGVPQMTAIMNVADALKNSHVKIISDGGIKYSGDIVKALAAGAHTVMLGSLLAGTDESPGERLNFQGKVFKRYRGMGSLGAMKQGSKDRYFQGGQSDHNKLVPEGIEGQVPYKGPLSDVIHQLIGGLKAGMGYTGAKDIESLHTHAKFVKITNAGLRESHIHDVTMTEIPPNYAL